MTDKELEQVTGGVDLEKYPTSLFSGMTLEIKKEDPTEVKGDTSSYTTTISGSNENYSTNK